MTKSFSGTDISAALAFASKVCINNWGPEYGVAVSVDTNEDDLRFCIWNVPAAGGVNRHYLDVRSASEARLSAHIQGFIENVQRSGAA